MSHLQRAFGLALALLVLLVLASLWPPGKPWHFKTDLLGLLPPSDQSELVDRASQSLTALAGDQFVYVLAGPDPQQVLHHAGQLAEQFSRAENAVYFTLWNPQSAFDEQQRYWQWLFEHRFQWLDPTLQQQLQNDGAEAVQATAWRSLFETAALGNFASAGDDPLQLFNRSLDAQERQPAQVSNQGQLLIIEKPGDARAFVALRGSVREGAFNLQAQEALLALDEQLGTSLPPSIEVWRSGAVFHGAKAAATAKAEITTIASGSLLGIVLLYLFCFGSLKPLLMSVASILFGCMVALLVSQWLFPDFHLLTLVFGASLIGVAVDYSLHYLTRLGPQETAEGRLRWLHALLPSLALGLLTSLLGYACLLQAPLPGLRQMAVFSIVGLASAWLFVVAVFPRLAVRKRQEPAAFLSYTADIWSRAWSRWPAARFAVLLLIVLLLVGLPGRVLVGGDLRIFHQPDADLLAQQQALASLLPAFAPNQFFIVEGDSEEAVLQSLEDTRPALDDLREQGAVGELLVLSDLLPSMRRQQAIYDLLAEGVYRDGAAATQLMEQAGFEPSAITAFHDAVRQASERRMDVAAWLAVARPDQRPLWLGEWQGRYYSLVLLKDVQDLQALQAFAAGHRAFRFVDTVADISAYLDRQLAEAAYLLALAFAAIALLLLLRFRRLASLWLLMVPLAASLLTIGLLALGGAVLTLFHVFGLFLVLGLGMDYSIFLSESASQAWPERRHCRLAILLSMLTSSLSFGLLALSSTPMISAFGSTVLLGSILNWMLVPLVEYTGRQAPTGPAANRQRS